MGRYPALAPAFLGWYRKGLNTLELGLRRASAL